MSSLTNFETVVRKYIKFADYGYVSNPTHMTKCLNMYVIRKSNVKCITLSEKVALNPYCTGHRNVTVVLCKKHYIDLSLLNIRLGTSNKCYLCMYLPSAYHTGYGGEEVYKKLAVVF